MSGGGQIGRHRSFESYREGGRTPIPDWSRGPSPLRRTHMNLRPTLSSRRPSPRWWLGLFTALVLALLSLGGAPGIARADVSDYPVTLYLSSTTSTLLAGSDTLVTGQGPGQGTNTLTGIASGSGSLTGPYTYAYTLIDPLTNGETGVSNPFSASVTATGKSVVTVSNLPVGGAHVHLYRQKSTGLFTEVADLPNNASSTYADSMSDATAALQPTLPQTQNRFSSTLGTTGWDDFEPGVATSLTNLPTGSTAFPQNPAAANPSLIGIAGITGKGWIVDANGGVSFAAGTWTFQVNVKASSGVNASSDLAVGMWKVKVSGGAITSSTMLVDPSGAGEPDANTNTITSGSTQHSISLSVPHSPFSLASDEHLYIQLYRDQWKTTSGQQLVSLLVYDGTAQIKRPSFPNVPALGAVNARVNTTPQLSATFTDPDGSDTGTLSFRLCSDVACATVLQSGSSAPGIANGANGTWTPSINLADKATYPDGTYYWQVQATDSAGNVSGWSNTSSFVVDTVPPTVTNVTSSPANGAYKASAPVPITVRFSEPVTVDTSGGTPTLALANGATATYASGSGGTDLTFNYIVGSGDTNTTHLACAATTPLVLHGATIRDAAHNDATLTLPSPGSAGSLDANTTIAVDTIPPTATSVTSTQASGSYKAGTVIPVTVNFSEPVVVTGTPTLALNTAPAENATYSSGSGTSALVFDYTVQAGDNVADLDYAATTSLGLNSGSLADRAGNNATLTLAPPGSLSASKNIRIDTNPPGTPSVSGPTDASYLGAAPTLGATFSNNDVGDSGSLDFEVCSDAACSIVKQSWSASGLADGASRSWTPSGLADGVYYWRVGAQDAAGNQSAWSAVSSFTLDTTAPTAPALGSIASRVNTTPQLSATFSDPGARDSGTLSFQLCSNSGCTSVLQSYTASGVANNATVSWTLGSLSDGTYYWRVRATDSAGNQSPWASGSITVDTVPPGAPVLVSPAAVARVKSPQLGATFVDSDSTDSGTVTFQLCSDAACSTVVGSSTSATVSGGTAVSWTPGGLSDGTYYWRLSATDAAGNQTGWTSTRSFVLDTNPPEVPTLTGPADAAYLGAAPALGATFINNDVGDSSTIDFQVCTDAACSSVVKSGSSASGLASGASGSWTPSGLADGTYYWQASATDAAGNQSLWSATRQFTLDTTAPTAPALGSVASRVNTTPQLSATFSDPGATDSGTLSFQLCSNSSCTTVLQKSTQSGIANNTTANWTPSNLSDRIYYWRARAQDAAGNQSAWSSVRSFTIDGTPPVAPVLVGFAGVRVRTAPALTALVDDPGDPADKARLLVELCTDPACTQVVTTGYSGTVPVGTLAGWQAPKLSDGPYYWRARAEDLVGNQSPWSAVDSFVVDSAAPTVPAAAGPAAGAIVNTARLSAAVTGLSRGGGSGIEFQVCADAACTRAVASGYVPVPASGAAPTWTPTGLRDGSYFWRLSAHDQAGNASAWSETMSFVLDQTPPGKPRGLKAKVSGRSLTLRWKAPARAAHLAGYVLLVNGRRILVVAAKTHSVRMKLRKGEARLFAVAAFDAAGNVGQPAIAVGPDLISLTLKQARGAAAPKPSVQSRRP